MGKEGYGNTIRDTGGLVQATIRYIPPRTSIEFVAGGKNAMVMTVESGMIPDPLASPDITAEWDE